MIGGWRWRGRSGLAADWPIHDLAENYLFSAHMVEHLLISLVAPPLLLLGLPAWMVRRLLRSPAAGGTVRVMARPLVAGLTFNAVLALSHAPFWVNGTLEHHFLHFWAHLLLFAVSMLMWFPVINRLEEFPSLGGPGRRPPCPFDISEVKPALGQALQ